MGPPGTRALQQLLLAVRQVHLAVSTERMAFGLTVVRTVGNDSPCLSGTYATFTNASYLTAYYDGTTDLTVQVTADGLFVWTHEFDEEPNCEFVGYRYSIPHVESIFTRDETFEVPEIAASASYFAIPYFRNLKSSLEQYGEMWAKRSTCEILRDAWLDAHRIVFKPGPEYLMRRSLARHLRSSLREHTGVSIMPEQNINETRPVDIKVTWASNRVALIEIKWLGKSAREGRTTSTANHSAQRARDGSVQLATYLDSYHSEVPHEETRGFLVVYDGRRRNIVLPPGEISEADATSYRHKEIEYDPAILARPDFEHPSRFFCEVELQAVQMPHDKL